MRTLTILEALHDIQNREAVLPVKDVTEPIIVYGAGELGQLAMDALTSVNIEVSHVIDQVTYPPRKVGNHSVVSISDITMEEMKESTTLVCVSKFPPDEISLYLKSRGFRDVRPFYDVSFLFGDNYPINNGWNSSDIERDHIDKVYDIIDLMGDNISAAHYTRFLYWHMFREEVLVDGALINVDNRYFIPEILRILSNNEVFVDVGAHCGAAVERFRLFTRKKYDNIYAFEPDDNNYEILLMGKSDCRDNYIKIALSSSEKDAKFKHGLGYASKIAEDGVKCRTRTLDSFHISASIIKIHVEGHELDVIQGAQDTIQKNRPIVMVTTYHNPDGVYKIPMKLSEICSDYIMLFRLHSYMGTGSVIYMIPKERLS